MDDAARIARPDLDRGGAHASGAARRNRFLYGIFTREDDWTAATAAVAEGKFIAECDASQWVGAMTHETLHDAGLFTAVAEVAWHELCARFGVERENRAAYGPWRYCPGRISHYAVPYDFYEELFEQHKEDGLVGKDVLEMVERDEMDADDYITSHAKLSRDEVAALLAAYNARYLFFIIQDFEGREHVAEKSVPLDANIEFVRTWHEKKSAPCHKGVPLPTLLDPRGLAPAEREELVRHDRCLELDAYGEEFEKIVQRIDLENEELFKEIEKAVKKAVKSVILDKWDTERKTDFLTSHFNWDDEKKKAWRDYVASCEADGETDDDTITLI